ncbi:MAG: family transcriptional regulator [Nocardia sp.]|uniref:BTAD domain-containing putative transcriptional regulator n=1 Tax=Nocardia sp. TaxID=1821 RepID=UPI0026156DCF|nr:BTAD domain-containing putative transcriptional regulator [Nocardia sp.]MCU1639926.1 family transcriptional regulator [Nocardia sp.]
MLTLGVLGPLWAADEHGPVALKGPRHRAVLARLLAARGRVVPVHQLVDDLWDEPPRDAVGTIQTFVAALRRALEPDRAPRQPARILVTAAPGYALRVDAEQVDAERFEALVRNAGDHLEAGRSATNNAAPTNTGAGHDLGTALRMIDSALVLWHGPAYAEFEGARWARGEIVRLGELRLLAMEQRARVLLELGRDAEAATMLEAHLHDHPLREQAWQLRALALYRSGRQADALAALRSVRATLRTELGVDPGAELRAIESAMLAHAPHLMPARQGNSVLGQSIRHAIVPAGIDSADPAGGTARIPGRISGQLAPASPLTAQSARGAGQRGNSAAGEPIPGRWAGVEGARPGRGLFVGRTGELSRLERAVQECVELGRARLVLISGVEGAGKSALAETFTATLAEQGWTIAWGASPADRGTPPSWPWSRMVAGLAAGGREVEPELLSESMNGDPAVARFLARQAAVGYLAEVARSGPVALVFDDLHWAGEETLELLTAFVIAPVAGPVLLVGTYRSTDLNTDLTAALARMAHREPVRVHLGGLDESETGELVRILAGADVGSTAIDRIHRRGNGNPFFTRELARLLREEGEAALDAVPAGVRDVVRHRLGALPLSEQTVLQQASVIGGEVDRELLVELAGDEHLVLSALDAALRAGFLYESDSAGVVFTHAVVRDVVYGEISAPRRSTWHAAVGELLDAAGVDSAVLAYHFGRAGTRATAARAGKYARDAALAAEREFAPHEAARLWQQAVVACERVGAVRDRLEATMGLVRALAVTGRLAEARLLRSETLRTAMELDDPELSARLIVAFDVPAVWTDNDDPESARRIAQAAELALRRLPGDERELRCRLLATIALELRNADGERGRAAAAEAEATARQLDDPALLALALDARFMQTFYRAGLAPERARLGLDLTTLSRGAGLVTFEVLGHLILIQAHSAAADFDKADEHAAAVDALAQRYGLPLVAVFTQWYSVLRQSLSASHAESEAAYRTVAAALRGTDMPGLERGLLSMALLCVRLRHGKPLGFDSGTDWGSHEPWVRPLLLLEQNRRDEARKALLTLPAPPPDLLLELRLCLIARAALELDEESLIRSVHDRLLPAAAELAGAGTGLITLEPVAHYLQLLDAALEHRPVR